MPMIVNNYPFKDKVIRLEYFHPNKVDIGRVLLYVDNISYSSSPIDKKGLENLEAIFAEEFPGSKVTIRPREK